MNELDVYYRALLEYRKLTTADRGCSATATAFAEADTEADKIVVTRAFCTIDEDWVDAIEKGLVHIEKAIKEERQFIQSNGEVIPIEKVKHVSTESVKHLAKHSNLISRVPEDEDDIVPDKLFTVERLNDYAVYENRFLYMLLCYLRDFVTIRYNKIVDLTNRYNGSLDMKKTITVPKRTVSYTVSLKEERRDDKYLREHNAQRDIIDRIDLILKAILAFLSTPLMECCAKVAMLKPPITKTNVLKMNNNFKGAVALYDFIVAYDKPGYTVDNMVTELGPFRSDIAEEIAEAGAMLSFLTYEHGLNIKDELKAAYDREEKRRRNEELLQKSEQLLALGRKVKKLGQSMDEYALMLEKHVKALTAECEKIEPLRREVEALKETEAKLTARVEELMGEVDGLKAELEAQALRHAEEIRQLNEAHEAEIRRINEEHEAEIAELKRIHEEEIAELKETHKREMDALIEAHQNEIDELKRIHKDEIDRLIDDYTTRINELNEAHEAEVSYLKDTHQREIDELTEAKERELEALKATHEREREALTDAMAAARSECDARLAEMLSERDAARVRADSIQESFDKLTEEKRLADARIKSMLFERGKLERDYTSEEDFNELEREYNLFTKLYREQWSKTKKQIRKNILNIKNFKGQTEQTEQKNDSVNGGNE